MKFAATLVISLLTSISYATPQPQLDLAPAAQSAPAQEPGAPRADDDVQVSKPGGAPVEWNPQDNDNPRPPPVDPLPVVPVPVIPQPRPTRPPAPVPTTPRRPPPPPPPSSTRAPRPPPPAPTPTRAPRPPPPPPPPSSATRPPWTRPPPPSSSLSRTTTIYLPKSERPPTATVRPSPGNNSSGNTRRNQTSCGSRNTLCAASEFCWDVSAHKVLGSRDTGTGVCFSSVCARDADCPNRQSCRAGECLLDSMACDARKKCPSTGNWICVSSGVNESGRCSYRGR